MTPVPELVPEAPEKGLSELSRLSGVFFEPKKAFTDIGARPRWIVPLLLLIVAGVVTCYFMGQRVGWDRITRSGFETSSRVQSLSPEQRAAAEKMLDKQIAFVPYMAYGYAVIGMPLSYLVIAGVLLLILKVLGARLAFRQTWAVVVYASLPGLISALAAIAILFLKNPEEFNARNPVGFNPGAYMDPMTTSRFAYSLASSLDLFVFWVMVLMAIGFSAAAPKFPFGKALFAVALPWAVWVLGKSALAGLFG